MFKVIILLVVMTIAGTAFAENPDLSSKGPDKPDVTYHYDPPQVIL